jgi:GxxExxY protein
MKAQPTLEELNPITKRIIGAAIEVHRCLGPGLLESTYERALCIEFEIRGISFVRQPSFSIHYKGRCVGEHRADLIVESAIVVELKAVDRMDPIFEAQMLTHLRGTGLRLGLLINFNTVLLKNGVTRRAL